MTTTQEDSSTFGGAAQASVAAGARIELDRLERIFGSTRALDGFSLSIQPAEFLALLGPSGCGKTTALRVLAGFERLDGGRVVVDGKDLSRVSSQKRDMGMVFQSYSLFPNMNAIDNVAYGLRMRRQRSKQRRKKAGDLLELVGLGDQRSKYPHQMSGGQQQRVALARALAIEPQVLLLDEPLSALDAKRAIRVARRDPRFAEAAVDHDCLRHPRSGRGALIADRVCVMSSGHNEQTATPADLYARPATPFVAEFVGVSSRVPVAADRQRRRHLRPAVPHSARRHRRPVATSTPCCGPRTSPSTSTRARRTSSPTGTSSARRRDSSCSSGRSRFASTSAATTPPTSSPGPEFACPSSRATSWLRLTSPRPRGTA